MSRVEEALLSPDKKSRFVYCDRHRIFRYPSETRSLPKPYDMIYVCMIMIRHCFFEVSESKKYRINKNQ